MKIILLIVSIVLGSPLYGDVINGTTDPIGKPRNLLTDPIAVGFPYTDPSGTTSVKNHTLTNLSSDRISTFTTSSQLYLENTSLTLDGNYTFTHGGVNIVGRVQINGSGNTVTIKNSSFFIEAGAELVIGEGVILEFSPTSSRQIAFYFGSDSSKLTLCDSTLKVDNTFGMHLIRGNLEINGDCTIDNVSTDTRKALWLGVGPDDSGDCKLKVNPGGKLTALNAGVVSFNQGSGSLNLSNGKGQITGNFLFEETLNVGEGIATLDLSSIRGKFKAGRINVFTSSEVIGSGLDLGEKPFDSLWTPDERYVILGTDNQTGSELQIYPFSPSTGLGTLSDSRDYGNQQLDGLALTPDGKFIAVALFTAAVPNLYLYSLNNDGELSEINNQQITGGAPKDIVFSPNGKYLIATSSNSFDAETEITVFEFDPSKSNPFGSSTGIGGIDVGGSTSDVFIVEFFPDGKHVLIGFDADTTNRLKLYAFDPLATNILTLVEEVEPLGEAFWNIGISPSGKYVIATQNGDPDKNFLTLYRMDFDSENSKFNQIGSLRVETGNTNARGGIFFPDGNHFAFTNNSISGGTEAKIYSFTPLQSPVFSLIGSGLELSEHGYGVIPSPSGLYVIVGLQGDGGGDTNDVYVYEPGRTPSDVSLVNAKLSVNDATIKLDKNTTLKDVNLEFN